MIKKSGFHSHRSTPKFLVLRKKYPVYFQWTKSGTIIYWGRVMSAAGIAEWWTFPDSMILCNVVDSIEKCKKVCKIFASHSSWGITLKTAQTCFLNIRWYGLAKTHSSTCSKRRECNRSDFLIPFRNNHKLFHKQITDCTIKNKPTSFVNRVQSLFAYKYC